MLSESQRMSSAQEAAFRIQYPNSKTRAVKIVALDKISARIVDEVSRLSWNGATFFTSLHFAAKSKPDETQAGMQAWLEDLAGRTQDLVGEVASADFVVVITAAGEDARAVTVIADACNLHNKTLVGLVVPQDGTSDADVTESLNHLRPFTRMLVVASGVDYVEAMLQALRA
jgi:hypothetical protein